MHRWLALFLCYAAILLGSGCGSASSLRARGGQPLTPTGNLPALAELAQPTRSISQAATGYFPLPLDEALASAGAVPTPDSLRLDAVGAVAFAVYGVYGFDGDNGPVSAKIETGTVSGEFYIGFSDYALGAWAFSGPYTGSAEVAIPNPSGLRLPEAFVSTRGASYLIVIAETGSGLTVTGLELGIQGGMHGPGPVTGVGFSGSAGVLLISWSPSADYARPDFAGYRVERAPLLLGAFEQLGAEPVQQPFILDTTAAANATYRYRICAQDCDGHISPWTTSTGGPAEGQLPNPVVLLKLPRQPLTAPAEVTFDLSSSFDPGLVGIASYELDFGGLVPPVSGLDPQLTVSLPPGCYQITATVTTADDPPRLGSAVGRLLVYPVWEDDPIMVREAAPPGGAAQSRLDHLRSLRHPDAGYVLLAGEDRTMDSLAVWIGSAGAMQLKRLPLYAGIDYIGEPAAVGSSICLPFASGGAFYVASCSGQELSCIRAAAQTLAAQVAIASDGTNVWLIYAQDNGGSYDLAYTTFSGAPRTGILASGLGDLFALDAVYDPANQTLEVVCSDNDSTEWLSWSTATQTVVANATLAAAISQEADIELDPATNRPAVIYSHDSRHRYRELDGTLSWTPEELVDDSETNYTPVDLLIANGQKLCYFAAGGGQAYLYRCDDAGVWARANTVSFSADSAYGVALLAADGSAADYARVADVAVNGQVYLDMLHTDGTDTLEWQVFAADGQGYELHSAAATDGLHAVWRGSMNQVTQHFASLDNGETWTDAGQLGTSLSSLDLASTSDGTLYLSAFDGGNDVLYFWNGAGWDARWSVGSDDRGRPFLGHDPAPSIRWVAYEPWSGTIHYVSGDELNGYSESNILSTAKPIWTGEMGGGATDNLCFTLTGGGQRDQGWLGLYAFGQGTAQLVANLLPEAPLDLMSMPASYGRELAAVTYVSGTNGAVTQCGVCLAGPTSQPVRYQVADGAVAQMAELPLGGWLAADPDAAYTQEARRTASCVSAAGATGVVLLSSWDGAESYFAWSNFGDWQILPLPAELKNMSAPELVVDLNGRWHIIYKDWLTDRMMCWNSK